MIFAIRLPVKSLIFGSLALLLASVPAASAPVRVGIAASVAGDVRLSNASNSKPVKIARRHRLSLGDTLHTKNKSRVQIMFLDRSTLALGSRGRLTINRFVYDPGKNRSTGASVAKGAFRFMSGRKSTNSSAKVRSPVGTIGIRGTVLDGIIGKDAVEIAKKEDFLDGVKSDKDTATLVVLRGPGANTQGDLTVGLAEVSAQGETVILNEPVLAAYIPRPGAPPIGPFRLSQRGLSKLQDRLAPRVTEANEGGGLLGKLLPVAAGIGLGLLLLNDGDDDNNGGPTATSTPTPQCTPTPNNPDCVY